MGSGSLGPAFASGMPPVMNEKAPRKNAGTAFARLSMTVPPLGKRAAYSSRVARSGLLHLLILGPTPGAAIGRWYRRQPGAPSGSRTYLNAAKCRMTTMRPIAILPPVSKPELASVAERVSQRLPRPSSVDESGRPSGASAAKNAGSQPFGPADDHLTVGRKTRAGRFH